MSRTPVGPVALLVVLVLAVVGGCSFLGDDDLELEPVPSAAPGAGAPPELRRFYEQDVVWRECREDLECAEIEVPLDYAEPDGEAITLAMLRAPAEDPGRRIGSLVVNPGGPGVSAVDYAARSGSTFGEELREVFDIVGVDPRGVAASTPVECRTDDELDAYIAADPDPDTPEELRRARALFRDFGQGCLDESGDLARHISTEESARDLDVVRSVLGQEQLTYFGASYGTLLGATYADLFPDRAGRLVLDGAIDPTVDVVEQAEVQAGGFETALRSYVEDCVDEGSCFLGDDVESGLDRIRGLLEELDSRPLPGDGERELTLGAAVYGIWAPLYDKTYWGLLDAGLEAALDGDGRPLLVLSDAYVSRGQEGYLNNSIEALLAINCLDRSGGLTPAQARREEARLLEASPTFGRIFAVGLVGCRDWPIRSGNEPGELTAAGSDPILVIGTTRDPATPLVWAEGLAEQLEAGVLVRRDGDGHTGYGVGNDCVDETVEAFLVSGVVPDSTVAC